MSATNEEILEKFFEDRPLELEEEDYEIVYELMQKAREDTLASVFIIDSASDCKDGCCEICEKKPERIIHADCARKKGVITKEMSKDKERIAELEKLLVKAKRYVSGGNFGGQLIKDIEKTLKEAEK